MLCDIEMEDLASSMLDDKKAVQDSRAFWRKDVTCSWYRARWFVSWPLD
jgi:hypothetical protein